MAVTGTPSANADTLTGDTAHDSIHGWGGDDGIDGGGNGTV